MADVGHELAAIRYVVVSAGLHVNVVASTALKLIRETFSCRNSAKFSTKILREKLEQIT